MKETQNHDKKFHDDDDYEFVPKGDNHIALEFELEPLNKGGAEGICGEAEEKGGEGKFFNLGREKANDEGIKESYALNEAAKVGVKEEENVGKNALDGTICVSLSNPHVLDCCLCYESLSFPIFQCKEGHVVCYVCCLHYEEKCPICLPIIHTYQRCKAIEKLLGSIKVPCFNAEYGCKEAFSLLMKNEHEKNCSYIPCFCPIPGCDFVAPSKELSLHVSHKHKDVVKIFEYDLSFFITLKSNEIIVLQEKNDYSVFVLKNNAAPHGNCIDISCIGPNSSPEHQYDIQATPQEHCNLKLQLQSLAKNIRCITLGAPSSGYILVPHGFFGPLNGSFMLGLKIRQ